MSHTSYTPDDDMVMIGLPPFRYLIPPHDEIHISCIFTWDKSKALYLQSAWQSITSKPVLVGGPAFGSPATDFTPGQYVKAGIIFTSRGCNNSCPWCSVPKLEGKLKELPIIPGNIIQDNNFLQTSQKHQQAVFDMLKSQRGICFKGGLQANLITDWHAEQFSAIKVKELWLACDTDNHIDSLQKALDILKHHGLGVTRPNKLPNERDVLKAYVLCALEGQDPITMHHNEQRLRVVYNMGVMPFAQLYQPLSDHKIEYSIPWKRFARQWSRPAAIYAHMKRIDPRVYPFQAI